VPACVAAVWLMASSFEGYLYRVGIIGLSIRGPLLVAAALLLYPEIWSYIAGLVVIAVCYAIALYQRKSVGA